MMVQNEKPELIDNRDISIQELLQKFWYWWLYLRTKWVLLLFAGAFGCAVGLGYALLKKPLYTATTTFVLEEDAGGGMGGLGQYAGLAAMVGLDIGGSSNGIFQGDNITALYKSRIMLERTLLTQVEVDGRKQLLIDRYVDIKDLRTKWKDKFENLVFTPVSRHPETRLADSLIGEVIEDINKKYLVVGKPDKKLNLISVAFTSESEDFSKAFNRVIVAVVNQFYIETKTKKSLDNIKVLQHQTDSVKAVMNGAISSAARAIDVTPNLNLTRSSQRTTPVQRSQFNAEANKAILTELVKNLELSKMNFLKNKPLIQVIDEPTFPIKPERPGKLKMTLFGGVLAFLIVLIGLIFQRFIKLAGKL